MAVQFLFFFRRCQCMLCLTKLQGSYTIYSIYNVLNFLLNYKIMLCSVIGSMCPESLQYLWNFKYITRFTYNIWPYQVQISSQGFAPLQD